MSISSQNKNKTTQKPRRLYLLTKVFFALALAVCAFFIAGFTASAGPVTLMDVSEVPEVRIVIDGSHKTYSDVTLKIHDRILLPFREVLTNLGVKNDDEHIIWNEGEQSVTVKTDNSEIKLTIGDADIVANGEKKTFDVAPYFYLKNNRTYVPVRAISELLDKLIMWEEESSTIYIRDKENHAQTVKLLEKINASDKLTKFAANAESTGKISIVSKDIKLPGANSENVLETSFKLKQYIEADLDSDTIYIKQTANVIDVDVNTETYIYGKKYFMKINGLNDKWTDVSTTTEFDIDSVMTQAKLLEKQLESSDVHNVAMGLSVSVGANGSHTLNGEPVNLVDINAVMENLTKTMNIGDIANIDMKIINMNFSQTMKNDLTPEKTDLYVEYEMSFTQTGANGNSVTIHVNCIQDGAVIYRNVSPDFKITVPKEIIDMS